LGNEHSAEDILVPTFVEALIGKVVLSAQCGWLHTAFLVAPPVDSELPSRGPAPTDFGKMTTLS